MRILKFLCVLVLFFQVYGGYDFPIKTKIINKFISMVSAYLTVDQYTQLINDLEPILTPNTTMDELKSAIIKAGMNALTTGQKFTVAGIAAKFVSKYGGYEDALNVLGTVMANNLQPFADQLTVMYLKYQDRGKTTERIFQRGYKMGDMFMTEKRVHTIYCRLETGFNDFNTTMWPYIKESFSKIILFNYLDGLGACS